MRLINKLYREEHKHRNDKDWTADDNLKWRQEYAPPILREIKEKLDILLALPDKELPPKSDLYTAVHFLDGEWYAMEGIFTRGELLVLHYGRGGQAGSHVLLADPVLHA